MPNSPSGRVGPSHFLLNLSDKGFEASKYYYNREWPQYKAYVWINRESNFVAYQLCKWAFDLWFFSSRGFQARNSKFWMTFKSWSLSLRYLKRASKLASKPWTSNFGYPKIFPTYSFRVTVSVVAKFYKIQKVLNFAYFNQKNTHISIVKVYKYTKLLQ